MFPPRVAVCRWLCAIVYRHIYAYMFIYVTMRPCRERGGESNQRAISTVSRRAGWRGQLGRDVASTRLSEPGALEQWVASKQQAEDREHGLADTHIELCCRLPHLRPFSVPLLVSSTVPRCQTCPRQGSSSFISRPAAQPWRHNEL